MLARARRWHPHPDREVQEAAVAWARRVRTPRPWSLPAALVAVAGFLVAEFVAAHHLTDEQTRDLLAQTVVGLLTLAALAQVYLRLRPARSAALVEAANLRAILARRPIDEPAPRRVLGAGWPRDAAVYVAIAPALVFTLVLLDQLGQDDGLYAAALAAGPLAFVAAAAAVGWGRTIRGFLTPTRNREAIWLDDEGMVLSQHGLALGWHEIVALDVQPLPGQRATFPVCVAVVLPQDVADAIIGRPKSTTDRRRLSRALDGGHVINLPADRLHHSPESIISAARAYLSAPV